MSLTSEFDDEVNIDIERVNEKVNEFYGDLVLASPVDSGEFRGAWELIPEGKLSWTIKNPMNYASFLWIGYRTINGHHFGSLQWFEGGEPMLKKFNEELRA